MYYNHVFFLQKKRVQDGQVKAVSLAYADPQSAELCRNSIDVFGGKELFLDVPEKTWVLIDYALQSVLVAEGFVGDADVFSLAACPDVDTCLAWSEERSAARSEAERRNLVPRSAYVRKATMEDLRDALTVGRSLVKAARCRGCHSLEGFGAGHAPSLTWKRFKYEQGWLETFLARPYRTRPAMGDLMMLKYTSENAEPNLQPRELTAVGDYLNRVASAKVPDERFRNELWEVYDCYGCHTRLYQEKPLAFVPTRIPEEIRRAVAERPIFQTCVGCHPFGDLQVVQPLPAGAPTAFATDLLLAFEKLSLNYLTAFLADPAYLEPGTKMPNLNLDQTQIDQVRQIALLIKQAIDGENLQPVHVYYELEKAAKP
jgi:mono/diheme cytochrome c family protein